jgi:hypothetical protein
MFPVAHLFWHENFAILPLHRCPLWQEHSLCLSQQSVRANLLALLPEPSQVLDMRPDIFSAPLPELVLINKKNRAKMLLLMRVYLFRQSSCLLDGRKDILINEYRTALTLTVDSEIAV